MKKLLFMLMLMMFINSIAEAQKGKKSNVMVNPNHKVAAILPDLNILLIAKITNGGTEVIYEPVAGVAGKIKIPADLIIKNIGFATSKLCKIVLYARFQKPRSFSEIEQGVAEGAFNELATSESLPLQPIMQGKDVWKNHSFVFNQFPNLASGKKIRLFAEIIYPAINGELSTTNNVSETFEVSLVTAR